VIVPILHDADATPDDIFESESFQEILTTLRALAANDDRIIEYFRAVSQGRQRTGGGSVEFDMDERIAQRIDLAQFVREIDLKCWDRLAKLSWRPFEDARAFAWKLKLRSESGWRAFCKGHLPKIGKLPPDIPASPQRVYGENGWKSMGDWLGTGRVADQFKEFRPYREARAFARRLKLKSQKEWRLFCKGKFARSGKRPADIPAAPNSIYADQGWKGFGDWLGTGRIADQIKQYRSFHQARAFARNLMLKSQFEWFAFSKGRMPRRGRLPSDIPAGPQNTYAGKGWVSWGNWLGTGRVAPQLRTFRPFRVARAFARKLKLKKQAEWFDFCKGRIPRLGQLPADIPTNPSLSYSGVGWKGYGDWLGTGSVAPRLRKFRCYDEARAFVRNLKLKSIDEWKAFCSGDKPRLGRRPRDIPSNPNSTYAGKGWKNWSDWLGTGTVATYNKKYRPFREARALVRNLGLKSRSEWTLFCKGRMPQLGRLPNDIPVGARNVYNNKGWESWGDWLGTGTVATYLIKYRSFRKARAFARDLKLMSNTEWRAFCRGAIPRIGMRPTDIPANPDKTYANNGWKGFGDWLGTRRTRQTHRKKR
jgi:hypothetical protein